MYTERLGNRDPGSIRQEADDRAGAHGEGHPGPGTGGQCHHAEGERGGRGGQKQCLECGAQVLTPPSCLPWGPMGVRDQAPLVALPPGSEAD